MRTSQVVGIVEVRQLLWRCRYLYGSTERRRFHTIRSHDLRALSTLPLQLRLLHLPEVVHRLAPLRLICLTGAQADFLICAILLNVLTALVTIDSIAQHLRRSFQPGRKACKFRR